MAVPYTFSTATSSIPLSQLDTNFATTITLGNTAIQLGNTVTTLNNMTLANVTISSGDVTITNVTVTTANVTTLNATTANVTTGTFANATVTNNLLLSNGTANGVVYLNTSKVATTGTGVVFTGTNFGIGTAVPQSKLVVTASNNFGFEFQPETGDFLAYNRTAGAYGPMSLWGTSIKFLTSASSIPVERASIDGNGNFTLNTGTANGVAYLNGSKVLTTGSALTFDGTNLGVGVSPTFYGGQVATAGSIAITGGNLLKLWNTGGTGVGGISSPGTDTLAFGLGSGFAEQMRLTSTGLGIGTSSPVNKLSVSNAGANGLEVAPAGTNSGTNILSINRSTSSFTTLNYYANDHRFYYGASNTEGLRLDSSGNLGLGVTPSAWSTAKAIQIGSTASLFSYNNVTTDVGSNVYYDGASYKYITTNSASFARQTSGGHSWFTAPSGTAGNTISFTQAMTLDASGNLGIGTTSPAYKLDIDKGSAGIVAKFKGGTKPAYIYSDDDAVYFCSDASVATAFGCNETSDYLTFFTGNTERARITSAGVLLVNRQALQSGITDACRLQVLGTSGDWVSAFQNSSSTAPYGLSVTYSGASPNGTGSQFLYCEDSTAVRASIRSNGGLANYQSNNVDLSDVRTKKEIASAPSYWDKIGALEIVTYKYNDQTHDDVNVGVIAQQVESVEPVWVDTDGFGEIPEDGVPLKTVYTKDIMFAAIKALQEAMTRIEQLEAKVAALEAK